MSRYGRFAYRTLGSVVARSAQSNVHLGMSLRKAHIRLRPEMYLGTSFMNMLVAFAAAVMLVATLAALSISDAVALPASVFVVLVPLPLVLAITIYLVTFVLPDVRAGNRARNIDANLPYAMNYIATMASAGVTPDRIFASLASQPMYGEVAREAAWITRDMRVLGFDLVHALASAIDRSPSRRFQDFLQGTLASLTSGGNLKDFLVSKADQFMYENRQEQRKFLENMGLIAESFVTVVVAAPLFLMVLLSVMTMMGDNPRQTLMLGYVFILVMLPLAQAGFLMTIKFITPEV